MLMKNSIRFVFFADTHLGFDYPIRPRIDRRRRGQDFFDNYHRVLSYAIDNKVDFMVHGGDFFFRSKVPATIVDLAYASLFEFAESGIPFYIVPGNHERSKLPISLLLTHPNIKVFDTPKNFITNFGDISLTISGFPFERENIRERCASLLQKTNWKKISADIKLLCIHQAVEGAQVGTQNYTFRYGKDVIRMSDIPQEFLAVLSGHIHRKQILWNHSKKNAPSRPVIFCGSTERTSFAERLEDKGFFEIELRLVDNDIWRIYRCDFIILPTRPMVEIYLDVGIDKNAIKPYLLSKIAKINPNAIVRLKCAGKPDDHIRAILTGAFLRENFPKTMSVELGSEFFHRVRSNDFSRSTAVKDD